MAKAQKKRKKPVEKPAQLFQPKDFLDLIAPAAVKFNTDSYVLGGLYRCVLALRGYPAATEELALLSHICNRAGVTLHLYARQVTAAEEEAIYHMRAACSFIRGSEKHNAGDGRHELTMEKTELTVSMEPERLDALRYFLAAKNKRTPQKELQRALEELYEAYVPAETRAYLDARCRPDRDRRRRPAASKATQMQKEEATDGDH